MVVTRASDRRVAIHDPLRKIAFLITNAQTICNRLRPHKYPDTCKVDSELIFYKNVHGQRVWQSVCRIFGLQPNSWSKYTSGARQFGEKHLMSLVRFTLFLGGERDARVKYDDLYYKTMEICAGPYDNFELLFAEILKGASIRTHLCKSALLVANIDNITKNGWDGKELLSRLIRLDYIVLEDLDEEHEGYVDQWAPVFMSHPDTWRLILTESNEIVGYWHFVPLFADEYTKALSGQMLDSEITEKKVQIFEFPGWYDIYFVTICMLPEYRKWSCIQLLFSSLFEHIARLAEGGIYINRVCAHGYNEYGIAMCRQFGMNRGAQHIRRGSIYEGIFKEVLKTSLFRKWPKLIEHYGVALNESKSE